MSNPEIPSKKRKELENGEEENSKKSKIECSNTVSDSPPGQDDTEQNHLTDETLADTKSGEAKEVDKVQVEWIYGNKLFEVERFGIYESLDRISL